MHLPTGIAVDADGRLFVADAWHHRVLVWNRIPEMNGAAPDFVIGQPDATSVEVNAGGGVTGSTMYWPYGIGFVGRRFVVTDTGNRRVLIWNEVPESGQPADVILGQDAPSDALENRGGTPGASSFRWPHAVAGDERELFVADAGNHRVLAWTPFPTGDCAASGVLGQRDFTSASEFPYVKQTAANLRFPYAVAADEHVLLVADTANNRVLVYEREGLATGMGRDAVLAIGQPDLSSNGENRWKRVEHDTLCWPYGIAFHEGTLAVADSGNNRVMLWAVSRVADAASDTAADLSSAEGVQDPNARSLRVCV
jgi:DNA-binding beta-propeller fold protein YncE